MARHFFDLAFTPAVLAEQERRGSRGLYEQARHWAVEEGGQPLSEREAAFIAARDSLYLASVSETGWPYVQHRGGPAGFVHRLDDHTLGWAEFAGNRQYVSIGNTSADDRVALVFMDYPNQRRLKLLGHLRGVDPTDRPDLAEDLAETLGTGGYRARVERFVLVTVEAFDWNCPQHITPRYTLAEVERAVAPLHARIAALEAQIAEKAAASTPEMAGPSPP